MFQKEQLAKGLETLGIENTSPETIERFIQFGELLMEKNKVMNLTAITKEEEIIALHFLDSAALLPYLPQTTGKLLDVGTGAGFPAVPLQILCPQLQVTLLDAVDKRLQWLEEIAEELDLPNMVTLHGRGEELAHKAEHREQYAIVTSRAVADLSVLAEITLPFLAVGGTFLAMKSVDSQEEIQAAEPTIEALGGKISSIVDYEIPEKNLFHRLLLIEKHSPTPEAYPRRWAKIKNSPIKGKQE